MDAVKLSPFSIFVGPEHLQHDGAEYLEHHALRYHVYPVPNSVALNEYISFAYEWSIKIAEPGEGNRADTSDTVALDERLFCMLK